jgi:formyltetrahydrofolate-dependent phosphoribosylglycinamide formyltransferase
MSRRLGILISGRGSNLQSIIDAIGRGELAADIAVVISNRPEAAGLLRAREAGLETVCLSQKNFDSRDAYDAAIARELEARKVDLVCLAGFMRILSPQFVARWRGRLLNIHPSLLPKYPGLEPQRRAIEAGDREAGCTVHFVDEGTDTGAPVLQTVVPVLPGDTPAALSARILEAEHRAYPEAIAKVLAGFQGPS